MSDRDDMEQFIDSVIEPLYTLDATYNTCASTDSCPIIFNEDDSE